MSELSLETKRKYVEIYRNNNHPNVRSFDDIPREARAKIARTHNFNTFNDSDSRVMNTPGESVADRVHNWRRSEMAADHAVKQQLEIDNPTPQKSGKELRLEYLESKSVDPLKRGRHDQQTREAKAELKAEKVEQAAIAELETVQAKLQSDPRYIGALENAKAYLELATTNEERADAIYQVRMLQSATNTQSLEHRVKNYWKAEAERRSVELENELKAQHQTLEQAKNLVVAHAEQSIKTLNAQKKVEEAKEKSE